MPLTKPGMIRKTIAAWLHRDKYKLIYHALSDNRKEIRLLHIQPALQHIDPIRCSLSTTFLDDDTADGGPQYEALSYVWGLDTHHNPVYVDGVPKPVTVNLYHALQHLRQASQERVMWVDALCINQKNPAERTHQVEMMRDVFERASSTTIWLGLSTRNESELAMKFLALLGNDENMHLDPTLMPCVEVEGKNILSLEIMAGLELFFGCSWWSRVWTVQELVLSRQPIFQRGPYLLEGQIVQQALVNLTRHIHYQSCCLSSINNHREGQNLIGYFNKLYDIVNLAANTGSLPLIISLFRNNRNATNPRDIIYGMLGLARGRYENVVQADYTQTIEAAFEATTIQMIQHTGSLEVLSHIPCVESELTLPSYVPDWTVSYNEVDHADWLNWLRNLDLYGACKGESARLTVIGHDCVQLKGIRVDEIDMTSSTLELDVRPGFLDALISFVGLRVPGAPGKYPICDSDFWSAVCGSLEFHASNGVISPRRMPKTGGQNSALFERCFAWNSKPASDFWGEHGRDLDLRNMTSLYDVMRTGRKFGITTSGRLAWCPQTCEKGDIISILTGGNVPFVLRKVENEKYKFLGDAHVQGIMDGEAVDEMHSNGKDWEDIRLI